MKKILFVSNTANFSKFNRPYMKWCLNEGWQVDYCAPDDEVISDCNKHFVLPIPRSPVSKNIFKCIHELRKIIEDEQYDLIHCHTPMGSVISRLAAKRIWKKKKVKIIYTAHGFHFFKGAPLLNWLLYYPIEKYLSRFTDVLITINREDFELAKNKFHAKKVIHMDGVGINLNRFYPVTTKNEKEELRVKFHLTPDDFVVLYTAEFIPRKNHQLVFDIIPELKKKIPELKLILAGKGKLLEQYKLLSKEKGFSEFTIFTGYTKEIDSYCRLSDLLLMPSFQEGLPISMIEAIATGLPVVASDIRGHNDVIENGVNGYLCNLKSEEAFIKAITDLYMDKTLRVSMGKENIVRVKKYSDEVAVNRIAEIYLDFFKE